MTISDKPIKKSKKRLKIVKVKSDLWVALMKLGIKLWVNAPSAKILRKRFGNLKATKKISLYTFAPKMEAVSVSLIKPKILDTKVPTLLVKNDLISIWNSTLKSFKRNFYQYLLLFVIVLRLFADIKR